MAGRQNRLAKHGFEVAMTENGADINHIVDSTDHNSGTNPQRRAL